MALRSVPGVASSVFIGGGYRYRLVVLSALSIVPIAVGVTQLLGGWIAGLLVVVVGCFAVGASRRTGVELRRLDADRVLVRLRVGPMVLWRRASQLSALLIEIDQRRNPSWLTRSKWPGLYSLVLTGVDGQRTWRKRLPPEYPDNLRSIDATAGLGRAQSLLSSLDSPE